MPGLRNMRHRPTIRYGLQGGCRCKGTPASCFRGAVLRGLEPVGISDWEHWLQLNFLPAKRWMVSWRNELYHSSERDFGVNWFSDLSVSYKADRWEISLIGSNIVGTSQYERVRVSSTVQSYTLTHLRPREVLLKLCWDL